MAVTLAKNGLKVISIDMDRKAQKVAKLKLKSLKLGKSVSLKHMNAERLQYKDNSFDYVISVNFMVIFYGWQEEFVATEKKRLLSPRPKTSCTWRPW